MSKAEQKREPRDASLTIAVTGATGAYAAELLVQKAPWPVALIASKHGRMVFEYECGSFDLLREQAEQVYDDGDLAALPASGSVPSAGMVVLPCTTNTLAKIASGIADTLITRAAHCHLKERRPLILCVRETPWTAIDFANAERVSAAGGIVMPMSPPFYMVTNEHPREVTMQTLLERYVDRVLGLLGCPLSQTWEDVC
jgi:4-hydroxy-3-polyprenylbenzoate decarboxylase